MTYDFTQEAANDMLEEADWEIAVKVEQINALTARAEQAEAERDAWKKFALHQVTCAACADNVYSCDDAIPMMVAIRKIDDTSKEWLDSEELAEAIENDKLKGGKA